jgi:putative peptidoglycan lipid II flippase
MEPPTIFKPKVRSHSVQSVAKPVMYVTFIGLIGKFLSLARDINVASVFGLVGNSDVYFYASTLLLLITTIITQSINTTVIPALSRAKLKGGDVEKSELFNNIISCVLLMSFLAVLALVSLTLWPPGIELLTPGFNEEQRSSFVWMIQMGAPSIIFLSIVAANRGYLQSEARFMETAFSELFLAVVGIVFIFYFADSWGLDILIIAVVVAPVLQIAVQRLGFSGLAYRYKPYIDLYNHEIKVIATLIIPVLITTGISDLSKLIDQALGSTLTTGSLSALAFGGKINALVIGICIVPLVTVIFPILSRSAASADYDAMRRELRRVVIIVIMITLPVSLAILVLSENIVAVIFERGSFDSNATVITSEVLFFYTLGLVSSGLRLILIKVFYSLQDTRSIVKCAVTASALNIVLNFILIGPLEHKGLALATSLSGWVLTFLLISSLKGKIGNIGSRDMVCSVVKIGLGSLVMFLVILFLDNLLLNGEMSLVNETIAIILVGMLGFIIYTSSLIMMKVEEAMWFVRMFNSKSNRRI